MDVKIHRIFHFGLGEEIPLYRGRMATQRATEASNKEEQIIRNTRQGLDLRRVWNTAVGGEEINNAASSLLFFFFYSFVVVERFLLTRPLWNILQSVLAWRSALLPVFLFPELLRCFPDALVYRGSWGWDGAANYPRRRRLLLPTKDTHGSGANIGQIVIKSFSTSFLKFLKAFICLLID